MGHPRNASVCHGLSTQEYCKKGKLIGWLVVVAAAACVVAGGIGFRRAIRLRCSRAATIGLWVACGLLGIAAGFLIAYPLDEKTRIYGFPFPSAIFERNETGQWLDFVGPLTFPLACLNVVIDAGIFLLIGVALLNRFALKGRGEP